MMAAIEKILHPIDLLRRRVICYSETRHSAFLIIENSDVVCLSCLSCLSRLGESRMEKRAYKPFGRIAN